MTKRAPVRSIVRTAWRGDVMTRGARALPEEMPIALTYNRSAYAVMLATPADLEDFALGFSLTEGIVETPSEIEELDIVPTDAGIELRMWLAPELADQMTQRQRRLAGPSGCGLCGWWDQGAGSKARSSETARTVTGMNGGDRGPGLPGLPDR